MRICVAVHGVNIMVFWPFCQELHGYRKQAFLIRNRVSNSSKFGIKGYVILKQMLLRPKQKLFCQNIYDNIWNSTQSKTDEIQQLMYKAHILNKNLLRHNFVKSKVLKQGIILKLF